jgi:hypothetical protein
MSANCFSNSEISANSGGKFQRTQGRSSGPGFKNDWLVKEVTGFNGWYTGAQLDFLLQAQKAIEDNNNR